LLWMDVLKSCADRRHERPKPVLIRRIEKEAQAAITLLRASEPDCLHMSCGLRVRLGKAGTSSASLCPVTISNWPGADSAWSCSTFRGSTAAAMSSNTAHSKQSLVCRWHSRHLILLPSDPASILWRQLAKHLTQREVQKLARPQNTISLRLCIIMTAQDCDAEDVIR